MGLGLGLGFGLGLGLGFGLERLAAQRALLLRSGHVGDDHGGLTHRVEYEGADEPAHAKARQQRDDARLHRALDCGLRRHLDSVGATLARKAQGTRHPVCRPLGQPHGAHVLLPCTLHPRPSCACYHSSRGVRGVGREARRAGRGMGWRGTCTVRTSCVGEL